jgi:hypothetical protein
MSETGVGAVDSMAPLVVLVNWFSSCLILLFNLSISCVDESGDFELVALTRGGSLEFVDLRLSFEGSTRLSELWLCCGDA